VLRVKKTWPAFEGMNFNIGRKGFRVLGFHEKIKGSDEGTFSISPASEQATLSHSASMSPIRCCQGQLPMDYVEGNEADDFQTLSENQRQEQLQVEALKSVVTLLQSSGPIFFPPISTTPQFVHDGFVRQHTGMLPFIDTFDFFGTMAENDGNMDLDVMEPQIVPKCFLRFPVDVDPRVASTVNENYVFLFMLEHLHRRMIWNLNDHQLNQEALSIMHFATIAVRDFEARFPNWAVMAINLRARTLDDVFLVQNEASIPLIGLVAKSHNGRFVKLMDVSDLHSLVRQAIFLTKFVPTEVDLVVSTYLRLMPLRDPQLVKLVLSMPKKGILLVAGEI